VGSGYFDAGGGLGVRWMPAAIGYVAEVLPSLPDGLEGAPMAINTAGVIAAGNAAALWTEGIGWRMLAWPSGATLCSGTFVNDAGQAVARCVSGGLTRAVFWSSVNALPTVLPLPGGTTQSYPLGISGSGVIAGHTAGTVNKATIWRPGAAGWTTEVLADIGNGGRAQGVNDAGYVVGFVSETNGNGIPVFWNPAGRLNHLQSIVSGVAVGISDGTSGLVIGGYVKTGRSVGDQIAAKWRP
jgi:hypothetical protein